MELWLPILLSAVFVFFVSSLFHMVIPIHKGDTKRLPGEDAVLQSMRDSSVGPGQYIFPCPEDMKDMGTPEMVEKLKQGPAGHLTVRHSFNMGLSLLQWFVYCLVLGSLIAYLATLSIDAGTDFVGVFRPLFLVGVLGYALGVVNDSIWKGQAWSISFKFVFDGVVYAGVTAATFAWLWPSAT